MDMNLLKEVDIRLVEREELVERSLVQIDANLSKEERITEYIKQIKNPYCYLDGNTVVKISFSDSPTTMEDCIANYLRGV